MIKSSDEHRLKPKKSFTKFPNWFAFCSKKKLLEILAEKILFYSVKTSMAKKFDFIQTLKLLDKLIIKRGLQSIGEL